MPAKILQEFDNYCKSLSARDKIAVLTDSDTDGISAGAITCKAILQITGKKPAMVLLAATQNKPLDEKTVERLRKQKISKFICADISMEEKNRLAVVKKVSKFARILNIDHHKVYGKLPKGNVLVKPQFFSKKDPTQYCAAKMCFDLFSRKTSLEGNEWIAALGLFGDFGKKAWLGFYRKALKKARLEEKEIKKMSYTITALKTLDFEKLNDCLKIITETKKPHNCLQKYYKFNEMQQKLLEKEEKRFWKNAEFHKELGCYFYFINSGKVSKRALTFILSLKKKNSTLVFFQNSKTKGSVDISAKRQDRKFAMNELLEKATKGLKNANAGGHIPAAGGKIRTRDLEKFKQKVLEILKEKQKRKN